MRRSGVAVLTTISVAGALVIAGPGAASDPGPTPASSAPMPAASTTYPSSETVVVKISPSSALIRFGKTLRLDGELSSDGCEGPFEIDIERRILGSRDLEVMRKDIEMIGPGSFTFSFPADFSAVYTATVARTSSCAGDSSPPKDVLVRSLIRSRGIERCPSSPVVTGRVLPRYPRTRVVLRNSKGRRVDRDILDGASTFELHPPACRRRYTIEWPSQDRANLKGTKVVTPPTS